MSVQKAHRRLKSLRVEATFPSSRTRFRRGGRVRSRLGAPVPDCRPAAGGL